MTDAETLLSDAATAETGDTLTVSPNCIQALAEQCFFDGIRLAASLSDDPVFQAKMWALARTAPSQSKGANDE